MTKKDWVKIFEGVQIPAWAWLSIVLLADAAHTLLGFTVGFDVANGKNPLFGMFGIIILTIIKNWFNKLQEWKAKNDAPPNSTTINQTKTTDSEITETKVTTTP